MGVFLLWCRRRQDAARIGLVLIFVWSACLVLSRIYGFFVDGGPGWFKAVGVVFEGGFAAFAVVLLLRGERGGLGPR